MVIPVGDRFQQMLQRVRRNEEAWRVEALLPVMFVPLYGRHGFAPPDDPLENES